MKPVCPTKAENRAKPWLASWLSCLLLVMLALILGTHQPQKIMAANTVQWKEVDPPATSGTFASMVSGDINEDGHLDLLGGTLGLGIWGVAGDGDGTWTPLGSVTASGTYYGLALGDVNNDGKLDLVGAEDGSGVRVWAGDGAGGWSAMTAPPVIAQVWGIALGDVDNDGYLDIALGSGEGDGLQVWAGDGAGGWTPASTGLPTEGDYTDLALADVDRDGKLDLVTTSPDKGVRAWRGSGGGSWTESSTGLPAGEAYYGLALGDLDHDGMLDIVASSDGLGLGAWAGSGGTVWSWIDASAELPGSGQYWDVGLSDLNNDGNLDIAATSYGGGVEAWVGDGGGNWSDESSGLPDTGFYYGLTLGDWDDDGMPDISAGQNAGVQAWVDVGIPGGPDGWLQIVSPTTSDSYQGLDMGDWNRDGKLDIVAASAGGGIQLWEGDGGNTWAEIAAWTNPDLPTSGSYLGVAFGDIDHNGWLDVVAGSGGEKGILVWRFMDSVAWIESSIGLPAAGAYLDVDLGDLDNDGWLDIAAAGQGVGVGAWLNDPGTGGWAPASTGLPSDENYNAVALGDLDDDGNLDIVASKDGAGLVVWQGDGAGSWTAQTSPAASRTFQGIAVGDVDDDGKLDLLVASDGYGVRLWAGDGAFGWSPLTEPSSSGRYTRVAIGDLNNDGKLDIAAGRADDAGLEVWTGDGGISWTPYSSSLPRRGTYPDVAFGEIDNDGFLDLVGAKDGGGSVHAWTGGEGAPPSGWDNFGPTGWISSTQEVDCSIQVQDTGSGLKVDQAGYSFLGATGTWSAWTRADCTGSDGTITLQTISAHEVPFNQDSGPHPLYEGNWIRFRAEDVAGNVGYSEPYLVKIDTTPPDNPTSFPDSSHWPGGPCLDDDTVWVDWAGASDATSGLDGYSYVFDMGYQLPDMTVDTWMSQATSDPLPDGHWYISVRTRDAAGNWAGDDVHEGPFCVDTGPPTNPTLIASSPHPGFWVNDNTINVEWSGADDAGSGVYGYSIAWSFSPDSTPDEIVDTTGNSTTSPELADDDRWHFHVRTRDYAGNWASDAEHHGPFFIDTVDPWAWIDMSIATVNTTSFTVRWDGFDLASGIDSFEVQSSTNDLDWSDWLTQTADHSASFTGESAQTYYFRVRARDIAGNVGDWSGSYDITVGVDVVVRVEDEWGNPLSGAVVYLNGLEQGATALDGTLTVPYVVLEDQLAAKYLLEEQATVKAEHEWPYGSNWAYRTYITNVDFDVDGQPLMYTVNSTVGTRVLRVRRDNTLVGFHILVSVEWDADEAYLDEIAAGFIRCDYPCNHASRRLFDLTDGQMLFEAVEIVDNGLHWAEADYKIHASNSMTPHAKPGGIWEGAGSDAELGRDRPEAWNTGRGRGTIVHEFGHYGLDLGDEYQDSDGIIDGGCTTDRDDVDIAERACVMDDSALSSEFCSGLGIHPHNTDTVQHARHLEPCWSTLWRRYRSTTEHWLLERPDDRGSIMPGPDSISVEDWTYYSVTDADTGVCPPFEHTWTYPDGTGVADASVLVWHSDTTHIYQGLTGADGDITVLGAYPGDELVAFVFCGASCYWYDVSTVSCAPRSAQPALQSTVQRAPFSVHLGVVPLDSADMLKVSARASTALAAPPDVQLWQEGATAPIPVPLAYDGAAGTYTGIVSLGTDLGRKGWLWCQATDTQGHTVTVPAPFNVQEVPVDQHVELISDDGNLELFFKPHSLAETAALGIVPNHRVNTTQDDLILVGNAYELSVSTGQQVLDQPAGLTIYYHGGMVTDVLSDTLQIYTWDAQAGRWVSLGGVHAPEYGLVSTLIDQLSTFAILGKRAGPKWVYLPLVLRNSQ